jgi:hypothetical protein
LLVRHCRVHVPWRKDSQLGESVLRQQDIAAVKVWRRNGILAWTNTIARSSSGQLVANRDRRLLGRRFPLDDELNEAVHENQAVAALFGTGANGEDSFERNDLGFQHLFEVYARSRTRSSARSARTRSTPTRARSTG